MTLDYFKDVLFDLLNESDLLDVSEIECDDGQGIFQITTGDGSRFQVQCEEMKSESE